MLDLVCTRRKGGGGFLYRGQFQGVGSFRVSEAKG